MSTVTVLCRRDREVRILNVKGATYVHTVDCTGERWREFEDASDRLHSRLQGIAYQGY